MRGSARVLRALVGTGRGATVTAQFGLIVAIALPLAVVVAMILWPSDYDE